MVWSRVLCIASWNSFTNGVGNIIVDVIWQCQRCWGLWPVHVVIVVVSPTVGCLNTFVVMDKEKKEINQKMDKKLTISNLELWNYMTTALKGFSIRNK